MRITKLFNQKVKVSTTQKNEPAKRLNAQTSIQKGRQKERRQNYVICLIGMNRTGKTTNMKKLIAQWRLNNPGRLVVGFDSQNQFNDLVDVFLFKHDKEWMQKMISYRNALIVLDDYRVIYESDKKCPELVELLHMRSFWNIDIIITCHNPSQVLNVIAGYITHYFIFYTQTQDGTFERKIPTYSLCINAANYIRRYVNKFGMGTWPNFPHIVVDCLQNKISTQNVDVHKFKRALQSEAS